MNVTAPPNCRTRIAPTPSGFLHWGNAASFLLTWLIARSSQGSIVLRIDDLDSARSRPEFIDDVFSSLDWLGLDFDEGPSSVAEFERLFSQRHRLEMYFAALERLQHCGLVFGCSCTRRTIRGSNPSGRHPNSCSQANRSLGDADIAWRATTATAQVVHWEDADGVARQVDLHDLMRDFVVKRKDGIPSYQIASLIDDTHFGINLIVRGEDLLASTAAQRWLATHLTKTLFLDSHFLHHPIASEDGAKLSKSAGATSLKTMRDSGSPVSALYQKLSDFLGLPEKASSAQEALSIWKTA